MKITAITLATAFSFAAAIILPTQWDLEKEGMKVEFNLPGGGTSGTFEEMTTNIQFDADALEESKIESTIKVASINTGEPKRDEHLRSADFFEVEKYPEILFRSESISKGEEGFVAEGTLTMKGQEGPVKLPFTFEEKDGNAWFKGTMQIISTDFGVKYKKEGENVVDIVIEVPVTKGE